MTAGARVSCPGARAVLALFLVAAGGAPGILAAAPDAGAAGLGGRSGRLPVVPDSSRHIVAASAAGPGPIAPFLVPDRAAYLRQKAAVETGRVKVRQAGAAFVTTDAGSGGSAPLLPAPPSPLTQASFAGGNTGAAPPDTQVAASDTRVVEEMNSSAFVFDKAGNQLSTFALAGFYGAGAGQSVTDPRIVWDSVSGRWFSTILICTPGPKQCNGNPNGVRLAVSKSADPSAANWVVYHITDETSALDDQPRLGFSADKLIVTFDQYSSFGASFNADYMYVVEKADAVALASSVRFTFFNMNSGLNHRFGIVGADPTPSDQGFITAFAAYHGSDILDSDQHFTSYAGAQRRR